MTSITKLLTEDNIDDTVTAQAEDETAWDEPVKVNRTVPATVHLPSELAARAAFFARIHHETNVESWVQRIVRERVDMEQAALAGLKRELVPGNSP